jgi:hypothetical protein
MRRAFLGLTLLFILGGGTAIGQCETGATSDGSKYDSQATSPATGCGTGGGGTGAWYQENFNWGWPYYGSAYAPGYAYTVAGNYGWSAIGPGSFMINGLHFYFWSATQVGVEMDGVFIGVLDANDPQSAYRVDQVAMALDGCGFWCRVKQISKEIFDDLWWAMKTGASHACNQATAKLGIDAMGAIGAIFIFGNAPNWTTGSVMAGAVNNFINDANQFRDACAH